MKNNETLRGCIDTFALDLTPPNSYIISFIMFLFPDRDKWQLPDSCGPLRSRPRPRAGREAGAADERARGGEQLPDAGDRDHQDRDPEQELHRGDGPLRGQRAGCGHRTKCQAIINYHRAKSKRSMPEKFLLLPSIVPYTSTCTSQEQSPRSCYTSVSYKRILF